jgi:uncharacterized membrane-anchored protein YjiN (DUF445 family)
MNKNLGTNVVALAVIVLGYFSPWFSDTIVMTGLFALSGGVTNWLAVHMLFEKIPLIYGSGVVPLHFEEFRAAIKKLLMQEFFSVENLDRFLADNNAVDASRVAGSIDHDRVFEGLAEAIEASPMGSMLGMLGGRQALEPLREPVGIKINALVEEWIQGAGTDGGGELSKTIAAQIEQVVESRLAELTPETVKQIVEDMIREHLGWLVVWGGIVGGLIGLLASVVQKL